MKTKKDKLPRFTKKEMEQYLKNKQVEQKYWLEHTDEIQRATEAFIRYYELKRLRKNKAKNKSRDLGR